MTDSLITRSCAGCGGGLWNDDIHQTIECGLCRQVFCDGCKPERFQQYFEEDVDTDVDHEGPFCDECLKD